MNTPNYEHTKKRNRTISKTLLITSLLFAGILVANTGYSQVYVHARVGFGIPIPRVYVAPPPVVYGDPYVDPAPYYDGYAPGPVVVGYGGYGGYGRGNYGHPVYRGGYARGGYYRGGDARGGYGGRGYAGGGYARGGYSRGGGGHRR